MAAMKIFELKRKPDFSGFVSLTQELVIQSAVGRKLFLNSVFLTDKELITNELNNIQSAISVINQDINKKDISTLYLLLSEIKDIEKTLSGLGSNDILNDIELFEVKTFALTAKKIFEVIQKFVASNQLLLKAQTDFDLQVFDIVIDALDPEKSGVATFYIYDAYSEKLDKLRKEESQTTDTQRLADLQMQILEIEHEIRVALSERLMPYAGDLTTALNRVAYLDLLFAKVQFAEKFELCCPRISDNKTEYIDIFNPEVKTLLKERGSLYQKTNIVFGNYPTLITGINMGGKTVMLKTLALCQMLFQYGFYVPATKADIMIKDKIMFSFTDEQNHLQGLSSFAAEMKKVNEIITQISENSKVLVLIDELARTTNPKEGASIVAAMLDILQDRRVSSFITTHYDIETTCRRLRVKGLKDGFENNHLFDTKKITDNIRSLLNSIDYQLIDDTKGGTPNEAIRIAEMLGVNKDLIIRAKTKIKHH